MSRANEFLRNIIEQGEIDPTASDLSDVLNEYDYGLATELDHNAENLSTGVNASTLFEISSDQGPNWVELRLWDKNRFDTPLGSVRFVCGMKANEDSLALSTGKGIEKISFDNKNDDIEKIPDIKSKEDYKDKIQRIRRIFLGFQLNISGVAGIPNDPNSFENIGRKVGRALIQKCAQYLK